MHIHEHMDQISLTGETLFNLVFIIYLVILRFIFTFNYVYVILCGGVCGCECSAARGQKRALYPLELELQVVMNYLSC